MESLLCRGALITLLLAVPAAVWGQPLPALDPTLYQIHVLDIPNAAGVTGQGTLHDLNQAGQAVGGFTPQFPDHGLQELAIRVTVPPTAQFVVTCGPAYDWTVAQGINRHPAIVGWCRHRTTRAIDGFYQGESSKVTILRYPGASMTEANTVNNIHRVLGDYLDPATGHVEGFVWERSTNRYTRFSFPGAVTTIPLGLNNHDTRVGVFETRPGDGHGFIWRKGQFQQVDAPGATMTMLLHVADNERIIGLMRRPGGETFSFILDEHGVFRTFSLPYPHVHFAMLTSQTTTGILAGHYEQRVPVDPANPLGPWDVYRASFVAFPIPPSIPSPHQGTVVAQRQTTLFQADTLVEAVGETVPSAVPPAVVAEGCPDTPVPAGQSRPGKLALSWALCR